MKLSFFSIVPLILTMLLSDSCTHKDLNDDAPTTIADNVEALVSGALLQSNTTSTLSAIVVGASS